MATWFSCIIVQVQVDVGVKLTTFYRFYMDDDKTMHQTKGKEHSVKNLQQYPKANE